MLSVRDSSEAETRVRTDRNTLCTTILRMHVLVRFSFFAGVLLNVLSTEFRSDISCSMTNITN